MALGISVRAPRAKPVGATSKAKVATSRIKELRVPGVANPNQADSPLGPQLGGMGLTMGMKHGIRNQSLKSAGARTSSRQSSRD